MDELPTYGRYWPRLLLEAADYGNLSEFLSSSPDATDWTTKVELILDVVSGLKTLHNHDVAHCDLKLENVLVFRPDKDSELPSRIKYQAKLCDFGFSVILNDYDENAMFAEKLGTEPWSSPELTFGTEIRVKDLPQSDIYSLGLLAARSFMGGGNPFEGLSAEEIREMKSHNEGDSLVLHNHITNAIFSQVAYSKAQRAVIQKLLLVTLLYQPSQRFPLHLVGMELLFLGTIFSEYVRLINSSEFDADPIQAGRKRRQSTLMNQVETRTNQKGYWRL